MCNCEKELAEIDFHGLEPHIGELESLAILMNDVRLQFDGEDGYEEKLHVLMDLMETKAKHLKKLFHGAWDNERGGDSLQHKQAA